MARYCTLAGAKGDTAEAHEGEVGLVAQDRHRDHLHALADGRAHRGGHRSRIGLCAAAMEEVEDSEPDRRGNGFHNGPRLASIGRPDRAPDGRTNRPALRADESTTPRQDRGAP